MEPRALKGKLVGRDSPHGHIFHVWLPDLEKVVRVRDVLFWEQVSGDPKIPPVRHEPEYDAIFR